MTHDQEREKFEAAFMQAYPDVKNYSRSHGSYVDGALHVGWVMWQAAKREPVVSVSDNAYGLMCTLLWTELCNAMKADQVDLSADKIKGGKNTRAVIEQLVKDTLHTHPPEAMAKDAAKWRKIRGMSLQDVINIFEPVWTDDRFGFDGKATIEKREAALLALTTPRGG